ncbi:neo-calmodulin-like isoform X1 [Mytilus trossulus]|uniref:neo-calmodulin-like isoform X1 n=1 Tax=Mytilus trossulus TaxID=6551 RepID=UPI003005AB9A
MISASSLGQAEKDEIRDMYDLYDTEKAGKLPQDDYATIVRGMGHNPSEKELQEMFQSTRPDRAGMVDYSDFLDAYAKHFNTRKNEEREIRQAFRVFDRNEEGMIDANELKQIVTTRGERLSESEAKSLIKEAEVDSQGKIDYEDLTKVIKV